MSCLKISGHDIFLLMSNNLDVFREPLWKMLAGRNLRYEIK